MTECARCDRQVYCTLCKKKVELYPYQFYKVGNQLWVRGNCPQDLGCGNFYNKFIRYEK
jgi:hypothetical protein